MSNKLPIDYARAESADVVRKKFRRRILMFVVATLVVMTIAGGWVHCSLGGTWRTGDSSNQPSSASSSGGWVRMFGPERTISLQLEFENHRRGIGSDAIGFGMWQVDAVAFPKWVIEVRYRTLLILAMITWIITLIRLIRIWKRKCSGTRSDLSTPIRADASSQSLSNH